MYKIINSFAFKFKYSNSSWILPSSNILFYTIFTFYLSYITSSRAFTANLLECGMITRFSHDVLQQTCRNYEELLPKIDHIIYLNRSVDFCMKNIAKRGREGENKISPAYLNGEFQYERIVNVLK